MVPTPSLGAHPAQGPRVGILAGMTASGKTSLALELARELRFAGKTLEIVNADSLQVYKGLDVGTAKPSKAELAEVAHHLIDIVDPSESFTAGDFFRQATEAIADIHARGHRALVVGGTGFYLKALLYGLWDAPPTDPKIRAELEGATDAALFAELKAADPASALKIGGTDRYRLVRALEIFRQSGKRPSELRESANRESNPAFELWVLDRSPEELYDRISRRTRHMLRPPTGEPGILDETRDLLVRAPASRCLQAVGYAQVARYINGTAPPGRKATNSLDDLGREIDLATRQLVHSQHKWFRKETAATPFVLDRERPHLWKEMLSLYE